MTTLHGQHETYDDERGRTRAIAEPPRTDADEPAEEKSEKSEPRRALTYLPEEAAAQASERWQRIQSEFVDDPRKAVADAHALVGELMQRIVDALTQERSDLEHRWSKSESASTEDLRVCLQGYRVFFARMLPTVEGARSTGSTT